MVRQGMRRVQETSPCPPSTRTTNRVTSRTRDVGKGDGPGGGRGTGTPRKSIFDVVHPTKRNCFRGCRCESRHPPRNRPGVHFTTPGLVSEDSVQGRKGEDFLVRFRSLSPYTTGNDPRTRNNTTWVLAGFLTVHGGSGTSVSLPDTWYPLPFRRPLGYSTPPTGHPSRSDTTGLRGRPSIPPVVRSVPLVVPSGTVAPTLIPDKVDPRRHA